jgi:hypothetical protein
MHNTPQHQAVPEAISGILDRLIAKSTDEDSVQVFQTVTKPEMRTPIEPDPPPVEAASVVEAVEKKDEYFHTRAVNSSFEINFAEFPLAYLHKGKLPAGVSRTRYQYKDFIAGANGAPVERIWTIEARATEEVDVAKDGVSRKEVIQLGFGGPATLELIYELFQILKEQGFKENKIHVGTYYYLLKRLGWGTGKAQYVQLRRTLDCLNGLHIDGESCFYNAELNRLENHKFHPFPRISTYTSDSKVISPDDYLYISLDEEFFKALKSHSVYYIPFDRFYFKKLKPMEQKLALMLAKIFTPYRKRQRFDWHRNIYDLSNQIPILTQEGNLIRRQLKRICDGLIAKDFPFLSSYKIEKDIITFYNNMQTSLDLKPDDAAAEKKDFDTVEWLVKEQLSICGDPHSRAFYTLVAKYVPVNMIYQALSEARQEGKIKCKLYTKIILERAKTYLAPHLNNPNDPGSIPEEKKKQIELERIRDKEVFSSRKAKFAPEANSDIDEGDGV